MATLWVGAIDCSFNYCGCALLARSRRGQAPTIATARIIVNKLKGKRSSLSDLERCSDLYTEVKSFANHVMDKQGKKLFAYEVPGGSQSSRAAACLGMAKGIIGSVLAQFNYEEYTRKSWIEVALTPSQVHKWVTGNIKASKNEIIDYVLKKYPNQIELVNKKYVVSEKHGNVFIANSYTKGEFEHIADAIVMAELGYNTSEAK